MAESLRILNGVDFDIAVPAFFVIAFMPFI
jgi:xanthine/uracil/vitamin C permease (AzgA family)